MNFKKYWIGSFVLFFMGLAEILGLDSVVAALCGADFIVFAIVILVVGIRLKLKAIRKKKLQQEIFCLDCEEGLLG